MYKRQARWIRMGTAIAILAAGVAIAWTMADRPAAVDTPPVQADADPEPAPDPHAMRVVILGTGTPNADPDRSGPATAIIAGGTAYLVDAGPGVVRRAAAADERHDLPGLAPHRLRYVFLTHLHSDHTLGLPDVMLGNWVLDRDFPLDVYGPPRTQELTAGIVAAWASDLEVRTGGLEPHTKSDYRAVTTEIEPGVVYADDRVSVEAIPVPHAEWPYAFGYKFTGGGRTIVISGDTRPSEALVDACNGCDILIHEVYSAEAWHRREPVWQKYHANAHTSTIELAELAQRARPKLLVLYHQLYWGATDADLLREIREAGYTGEVVSASDLDIF